MTYPSKDQDGGPTTRDIGGDQSTRPKTLHRPTTTGPEDMTGRSNAHQEEMSNEDADPQNTPFAQPPEEFMHRLLHLLSYLGVPETGLGFLRTLISPLLNGLQRYIRGIVEHILRAPGFSNLAAAHTSLVSSPNRDGNDAA